MKKFYFAVAGSIVLCAAGFTGYKIYEYQTMSPYEVLMQKNIEALSDLETWEDCDNNVHMAPNGVLAAGEADHYVTVTANSSGEIEIGNRVKGGYEAGKTYDVVYQILNCETWQGSCCDQTKVGIYIVSTSLKW